MAGVINRTALRQDGVAADVFIRGQLAVVIVHHQLEVDQPVGEDAKEEREENADQGATGSAIPLHGRLRWLTTACTSSSPAGWLEEFSLTMLCSVIGIIWR